VLRRRGETATHGLPDGVPVDVQVRLIQTGVRRIGQVLGCGRRPHREETRPQPVCCLRQHLIQAIAEPVKGPGRHHEPWRHRIPHPGQQAQDGRFPTDNIPIGAALVKRDQ